MAGGGEWELTFSGTRWHGLSVGIMASNAQILGLYRRLIINAITNQIRGASFVSGESGGSPVYRFQAFSPMFAFILNFNTFKQSFSTNVNAIKRRFSSSDLANESALQDEDGSTPGTTSVTSTPEAGIRNDGTRGVGGASRGQYSGGAVPPPPSQPPSTISAPTSPIKAGTSILQRVQSLTGAVTKEVTTTVSSVIDKYSSNTNIKIERNIKDLIILVVDDYKTEWSKYFPTTLQNYNLKLIQLHINQFYTLATESTTLVFPMVSNGTGTGSIPAPFIPDFVFFRQPLNNYKSLLISFNYTNVESINNLQSLYNGLDKPWIWGQLNALKLPLIEQIFYSDFRSMGYYYFRSSNILKLGSYHGGLGKLKVKDVNEWQDSIGIVQLSKDYCTAEPYIETRTEVHLQKIGPQYKGFMKKSLGPSWKSSTSNTILEEIQITERYRSYLDSVARHLTLDILQLEFLVYQGKEYLIELNDSSSLNFLGEGQEEDKKLIVEMILQRLGGLTGNEEWARRRSMVAGTSGGGGVMVRRGSVSGSDDKSASTLTRRESQGSIKYLKQNSMTEGASGTATGTTGGGGEDDTMKNLRKTFAGIFGDM